MKAVTLLLAALVLGSALLAAAPAAEARQACVYDGRSDPCDSWLVCVWDHAAGGWRCEGYVGCGPQCGLIP